MKNLFLAPCDSPNFDETVTQAVDLTQLSEYPSPLDGEQMVRFWGAKVGSRNESNYETMQPGDLVLFYQDGCYIATAWIDFKLQDEEGWASQNYWGGGESYLLYTVSDVEEISVPKEKVNTIFGYSESYSPRGLMRVAPSNVTKRPAAIKLALSRVS